MNERIKRYLVSDAGVAYLQPLALDRYVVSAYYTRIEDHRTLCYRAIDSQTYSKTLRQNGMYQEETVSKDEYRLNKNYRIGNEIIKDVIKGVVNHAPFELHCYRNELEGIAVLFCDAIDPIPQHLIVRSIDDEPKYDEINLARYPKPIEYDVNDYLRELYRGEPVNLFFWQVPGKIYTYDALALLLQKNGLLMRYYAQGFIQKPNMAFLHRFRILIRRTITLMQAFNRYLNQEHTSRITRRLHHIYEATKTLRYLYFLDDLYTLSYEKTVTFYTYLQQTMQEQIADAVKLLCDSITTETLQSLLDIKNNLVTCDYLLLSQTAPEAIYNALHDFKRTLHAIDADRIADKTDELFTKVDDLQTLMEDFNHIIGQKRLMPLKDEVDILFHPLREYKNCQERKKVLLSLQNQHPSCRIQPYLCAHISSLTKKLVRSAKILKTADLSF